MCRRLLASSPARGRNSGNSFCRPQIARGSTHFPMARRFGLRFYLIFETLHLVPRGEKSFNGLAETLIACRSVSVYCSIFGRRNLNERCY
jgi:hypothetical protein